MCRNRLLVSSLSFFPPLRSPWVSPRARRFRGSFLFDRCARVTSRRFTFPLVGTAEGVAFRFFFPVCCLLRVFLLAVHYRRAQGRAAPNAMPGAISKQKSQGKKKDTGADGDWLDADNAFFPFLAAFILFFFLALPSGSWAPPLLFFCKLISSGPLGRRHEVARTKHQRPKKGQSQRFIFPSFFDKAQTHGLSAQCGCARKKKKENPHRRSEPGIGLLRFYRALGKIITEERKLRFLFFFYRVVVAVCGTLSPFLLQREKEKVDCLFSRDSFFLHRNLPFSKPRCVRERKNVFAASQDAQNTNQRECDDKR